VFIGLTYAHNWMTSPVSRDGNQASTTIPCDGTNPTNPRTNVVGNAPYSVTWTVNHPTDSATYDLYVVPKGQESTLEGLSASGFQHVTADIPSSEGGTSITLTPNNFPPGDYVLQFRWAGWRNCADITITIDPPTGASEQPDGTWRTADGHGTWNPTTGVITCDSGYTLSGTTCVGGSAGGLSGGAIFGIFLLVLVCVSVGAIVGIMMFLKFKKPLTYSAVVMASKRKFTAAKSAITGN